jgi:hypothetical protein
MLGKVAAYENREHWTAADIWIWASDDPFYRARSACASFDTLARRWLRAGIRSSAPGSNAEFNRGGFGVISFLDPVHKTIVHELGHYFLGVRDEYIDGNGSEAWLYRWLHFWEFPLQGYGLMENQSSPHVTEMSTWCLYLGSYPPNPEPQSVSAQYYLRRRPCWEDVSRSFSGQYNGIQVNISTTYLTTPDRSHLDGPNTQREGLGCPRSHGHSDCGV